MNKKNRTARTLLASALLSCLLMAAAPAAFAEVETLPWVTAEMTSPAYWTEGTEDADANAA